MSTVISVENLGKKYTISHQQRGDNSSLREVITNSVTSFGSKLIKPFCGNLAPCPLPHDPAVEDFWALKDVSFEVKQGERIGIIGRNGAGKSTLLKILSRITEPTTGRVRIKGRVASLLEVGTGFHPELTGRENIYLNGAILGMGRQEINRKFDEIVAFSEIEKFLDTPVKRYSSGMYVRLAFAVAAHLEPEILIVDEVLAVGDAQFQKKCLGKMEDVGREGRTVLFVSHNLPSISALCTTAVLLEKGSLVCSGSVEIVVNSYLRSFAPDISQCCDLSGSVRSAGTIRAIRKAWFEDTHGDMVTSVPMGGPLTVCFSYVFDRIYANPDFGIGVETLDGVRIFSSNHTVTGTSKLSVSLSGVIRCNISDIPLVPGVYAVSFAIVDSGVEWIDYVERAVTFDVLAADVYGTGKLFERSQGLVFAYSTISADAPESMPLTVQQS